MKKKETTTDADQRQAPEPLRGGDLNPPLLPLTDCILPDRWLNIPACLVSAFQADIENQEYLERFIKSLSHTVTRMDTRLANTRDQLEKQITRECELVKREGQREKLGLETKIKASLTDIRGIVAASEAALAAEKKKTAQLQEEMTAV